MLVSASPSSLLPLLTKELWRPSLRCPTPPCFVPPSLPRAQQQEPSPDDASKLRPDINPSVLRVLYGEQPAASLIEANLRKRARASHSPSDGEPQLSLSSPLADDAQQAITSVIWEEVPEDLALPNFMFLDFLARRYRYLVFFHLLQEADVSPAALLWFILPSEAIWFEPPTLPPSLLSEWAKWKTFVAADLSRVAGDKRIYLEAGRQFWEFWHDQNISPDMRIDLTAALALILDVELLEAVRLVGGAEGVDIAGVEKRLGDSSAALGGAMRKLQKESADPQAVWENVLKGTSIATDGRVFVFEEALIFSVTKDLSVPDAKSEAGLACPFSQVEKRLKENYPSRVVLFLRSKADGELFYVVIAPWYWFLSTDWDDAPLFCWILFAFSCLAASQFVAADPSLNSSWITWESGVVPLGWSAILASGIMAMKLMAAKHGSSSSPRSLLMFAFPHLGAVGRYCSLGAAVPSRAILLDIVLTGCCASLLVSSLLLAFGFAFWGPSHFNSTLTADFEGYLLVPPDLFSYSQVFTKLLNSASVSLLKVEEDGHLALAVSPFSLTGILGLNVMAFSLFPTAQKSDGFLLLKALLGDTKLAAGISLALTAALSIVLFSKSPILGSCWLAYSFFSGSEISYIKDEVSEPSFLERTAGFVLVAAAVICFVPVFP